LQDGVTRIARTFRNFRKRKHGLVT
jgi:hypothetical protein